MLPLGYGIAVPKQWQDELRKQVFSLTYLAAVAAAIRFGMGQRNIIPMHPDWLIPAIKVRLGFAPLESSH